MKATLSVVDESGNRYQADVELFPAPPGPAKLMDAHITPQADSEIEFGLPIRAFVRKYAAGNSGGATKFAVLLAFLAKGANSAEISSETLRAEWNKLTAHLGAFNRAHATRAKDRAWADSLAHGKYRLGPSWREAFNQE